MMLFIIHCSDVIMSATGSQITGISIIYSTVCSGADKKNQSSASLAFVRRIHWWPVNSPHKGTVTRKMSPFDDVILTLVITYSPSCDTCKGYFRDLYSWISIASACDVP